MMKWFATSCLLALLFVCSNGLEANKTDGPKWHWRTVGNTDNPDAITESSNIYAKANEIYSVLPNSSVTTELSTEAGASEIISASSELTSSGNSSSEVEPAVEVSGRSALGIHGQRGREARIINDAKLSIQGFIPIVGLSTDKANKKVHEESYESDNEYHPSKGPDYSQSLSPSPVYTPPSDPIYSSGSTQLSNPYSKYGKSKVTYSSERPLYTEQGKSPDEHYAGPQDAKFIGALANIFRPQSHQNHFAPINKEKCVCVPFYLCKNGYLVASGKHEDIDERSAARSFAYENETAPAYASDVLARMIGASVTGECGLLRTCCKVPGGYEEFPEYPHGHPAGSHIGSLLGGSYPVHRPQRRPKPSRVSVLQGPLNQYPIGVSPGYKPAHVIDSIPLPGNIYPQDIITKPGYQHSIHRPPPVYPPPRPYPVPQQIPQYSTCGVRNGFGIHGRIKNLQYHDDSTEFGEYPWQAAILKKLGPIDSLYVCGGVLISSQWIATAAHCVKSVGPYDLKVRLGEWDVHREDEFYPYVEKFVQDIFIHPEFFPGNLVHDIALLRLDSPVDLNNPHITPACMPEPHESFVGQRCWVTGWGKDAFGSKGEYQAVLKEVDVPILSHHDCQGRLRKTRLGPYYTLHPGFLCAGGEPGKDACEGDGGSPLVCERHGVWKVAGLVSWGIGCGKPGVPGVYINLSQYRPWIDSFVNRYGYGYPQDRGNSPITERSNGGAHQQEQRVASASEAKAESRAE